MRKIRLLIACCIAACLAVPMASPATAQEPECPQNWVGDFLSDLIPPNPSGPLVEFDEETLTIRGDVVAGNVVALADFYTSRIEGFLSCLQQAVHGTVTPYADCIRATTDDILASPDVVARYVEVGTDLVVKVHYAQALRDVVAIFNCNRIVTYGG